MLLTRANKETIVITVENFWDWMDLFDNGALDEIELISRQLKPSIS